MKNMEKIPESDENNFYKNRTIKYLENTLQDLKIFYEGYKKNIYSNLQINLENIHLEIED